MDEQLKALLPDKRLLGPTTAVTLLRLVLITPIVLVLRLIGLASHLALAIAPYGLHTCFGITDVSDAIRERRVRLTTRIASKDIEVKMSAWGSRQ